MDESGQRADLVECSAAELHELMNLLSAIRLSAGLALKSAAADRVLRKDLQTIAEVAARGAELVQRLQARAGDGS